MSERTRICPICEAGCNLRVQLDGDTIVSCRGNDDDVFSRGHICPKGVALQELHEDPDRLRTPLVRDAQGELQPASWEAAYERILSGLQAVRTAHGSDAVATYIGNPTAHNISLGMGLGVLSQALGSRSVFSAGSVDQLPKQLAVELMFGDGMAIAVPDIERTDHLLILGANPIVSNGSLWVVPGIRGKLREMRARGGKLVVIDPRRSETAALADEHHFIRPGTDAWLLGAIASELLVAGCEPDVPVSGLDQLRRLIGGISTDEAARRTGVPAETIRHLARDLIDAKSAAVYGRVGTTLQRFGTLTSFLVDVVNLLTGNLDQPGGVMFPQQPFASPGGKPKDDGDLNYARYHSRVSGYPEVLGQLPVACLAEEIETPGEGQIRALVLVAGNPVVSNPESERLTEAFAGLDFMLSIDLYLTESNRHADVILPGTSPFEEPHYNSFLGAMTYRNTARYSEPLLKTSGQPSEWQLMLELAYLISAGERATSQALAEFEEGVLGASVAAYLEGTDLDAEQVLAELSAHHGIARMLDLGIRMGPWGDGFGQREGLTLKQIAREQNSIDMGPLRSRLDEVVQHADGCVHLAPEVLMADLERLVAEPAEEGLLLVGRRNIQTNNSWLHNLPLLSTGPDRACLEMHPQDAERRQIGDGDRVKVRSSVGVIEAPVKLSAALMPGTVCMPHGFSEEPRSGQSVARSGPNSNAIAPAGYVDGPSATVALNGIPVSVER